MRMECISRLRNLFSNVFRQVAKLLGVIASLRLAGITKLNMLRFRYGVTITSPTQGLNFDSSLWLIASRSNKTKLLSESRLRSSVMKCMNPLVSVPKLADINVSCTNIPDVSLDFFHLANVDSSSG